jgi:hypothetical protein
MTSHSTFLDTMLFKRHDLGERATSEQIGKVLGYKVVYTFDAKQP